MCGIIGFAGEGFSVNDLITGLKGLEYRGYDSAGLSALVDERFHTVRSVGRVKTLGAKVQKSDFFGASAMIGHTRWATHGAPTEENAHPQTSCDGRFVVVHNGIIENAEELRRELAEEGVIFKSETDTEVIPNLFSKYFRGDPKEAAVKTFGRLEGSFAVCLMGKMLKGVIIAAAKDSPLAVGVGDKKCALSSDAFLLGAFSNEIYRLEKGEFAVIEGNRAEFFSSDGTKHQKSPVNLTGGCEQNQKEGFPHFMMKEMFEQPRAVRETLDAFIKNGRVCLEEYGLGSVMQFDKLLILGCGSAYNAGLVAKMVIERLAGLPTEVCIASEYRYTNVPTDKNTLCVAVSQSGETADTVAAAKQAKKGGATVVALVNNPHTLLSAHCDITLMTRAGREVAVATTKCYSAQLAVFYLLGIFLGVQRGGLSAEEEASLVAELLSLPEKIGKCLTLSEQTVDIAKGISGEGSVFFIGRGVDALTAAECSLKLKEISYLHSEAYAAGELKHGSIALVEKGTRVFALCSEASLAPKLISNIREVEARGGRVSVSTTEGMVQSAEIVLPSVNPLFSPSLQVIPFQFLAYHTALIRGNDPDKPRNLAKSVTVE